jgi:hypothetical protein
LALDLTVNSTSTSTEASRLTAAAHVNTLNVRMRLTPFYSTVTAKRVSTLSAEHRSTAAALKKNRLPARLRHSFDGYAEGGLAKTSLEHLSKLFVDPERQRF